MTTRARTPGPAKLARNAAYYRRRAEETAHGATSAFYRAKAAAIEDGLHAATRCRECGAHLEDDTSVSRGYGPTCWDKPTVRERVAERGESPWPS